MFQALRQASSTFITPMQPQQHTPGAPSMSAETTIRQLVAQPPAARLWLQHRHSLHSAPDCLRLVLELGCAAAQHTWPDAEHPGAQLVNLLGSIGEHHASQQRENDQGETTFIDWHSLRPDHHLQRIGVSALNAVLKTMGLQALPATVTLPALPDPQKKPDAWGYVRSTELALRWLGATAANSTTPASIPWALHAEPVPRCAEACVRVLLQAGEGGAVAVLRVRAVREPGAHLLLAPMPASVCLLLDADLGRSLETVSQFLQHTLHDQTGLPGLMDIALAWDLAPAIGEDTPLDAIAGDSAGTAFACAALLALAPYAPPALRNSLWAARDLMGETFMTAALNTQGALQPVGGLTGKASALQVLAQALTVWAQRPDTRSLAQHPIYLAPGQPGQAQLPAVFRAETPPTVTDLLHQVARRAQPASPVHDQALSLVLAHPQDLGAAAAALSASSQQGLAARLQDEPVHHWRHLAVRDLVRWEHQGGPLQTEFVPLTISGRSGGAYGGGRYTGLVQLLAELDERLNPTAFALEGPPGAGKTTLLRHHMQWLCHQALCTAPKVLPMYLSLASWDDTAVPSEYRRTQRARDQWFRQFVRGQVQRQLDQERWCQPLKASLDETTSTAAWAWRWLIDGLNELPHPADETREQRARAVVTALKAEYGMRLPMLLSVREDHMNHPAWTWVRVDAWDEHGIAAYLGKRFALLNHQSPGLGQKTANKVLTLLQALPESSRALYTRPMALAMVCDVYLESPDQGPPPHRAALYTATLWFLLRRELGHTRHTARHPLLFENNELLSTADRDWIGQATNWPASADALPQNGLLLRGLMDQAEHQYWGELEQGLQQDQRCRVAVPLNEVQLHTGRACAANDELRQQWLQAIEVLGLADPQAMRRTEFRFAHQSWGEFLASVRLLRGDPATLQTQKDQGQADAQGRWQRIFERTRAPEAGRADSQGQVAVRGAEAELQAMAQGITEAWGRVPHAVWKRLQAQGLRASLDAVVLELSPNKTQPVSTEVFWHWASRLNAPLVQNPGQHNPEVDTLWPDGLGGLHLHPGRWADARAVRARIGHDDWAAHPAGWLTWYQSLWRPFQRAFDGWLRAQPELADEQGQQRIKTLLDSQGRLCLPPPADTREVLTLAICGLPPQRAADWLAAFITHGDWRATVPAALLLRPLLEAPKPGLPVNDGYWFDEPGHRHPVLQHLRRLLLLRTVDAGAAVRRRLRHGGVLAALTQPVARLNAQYPALVVHWHRIWGQAFATGPGVDLRERLQAGLWLGELGDNLRYLRWVASDQAPEDAAGRVGICLHLRHWRGPGKPGQVLPFRIGDDHNGWDDNQPEWTLELPAARLAAYSVTVMEWLALAGQPVPPVLQRQPSDLNDPERNNPLMPLTGVNWYEAMGLTDWYRPIYQDLLASLGPVHWRAPQVWALNLPTEVEREAWARGPVQAGQPQAAYTHTLSTDDPPQPLLFNHHATRWHRPNPVGVFSRGLNPWGIDDLAGNVWNWCVNAHTANYDGPNGKAAHRRLTVDTARAMNSPQLALRGGSFNLSAHDALAASRNRSRPDGIGNNIGLRWQIESVP